MNALVTGHGAARILYGTTIVSISTGQKLLMAQWLWHKRDEPLLQCPGKLVVVFPVFHFSSLVGRSAPESD